MNDLNVWSCRGSLSLNSVCLDVNVPGGEDRPTQSQNQHEFFMCNVWFCCNGAIVCKMCSLRSLSTVFHPMVVSLMLSLDSLSVTTGFATQTFRQHDQSQPGLNTMTLGSVQLCFGPKYDRSVLIGILILSWGRYLASKTRLIFASLTQSGASGIRSFPFGSMCLDGDDFQLNTSARYNHHHHHWDKKESFRLKLGKSV